MGIAGIITAIFGGVLFAIIIENSWDNVSPISVDNDDCDDATSFDDNGTIRVMPEQIENAKVLLKRMSEEAKASQKSFVGEIADEVAPQGSFLRNVATIAAGVSIPLLLFGGSNNITNNFGGDCDL